MTGAEDIQKAKMSPRLRSQGMPRLLALAAVVVAIAPWADLAWLTPQGETPRRQALVAGIVLSAPDATLAEQVSVSDVKYDKYGRMLWSDSKLFHSEGAPEKYAGSVLFNGKPKVFVAGSTGELGRRVVVDCIQNGMSVYEAYRDEGRRAECGYVNKSTSRYESVIVPNVLIETGRQEELKYQLQEASVVVHTAGAKEQFDIFRPFTVGNSAYEAEAVDLNGTKALVDAAVATGVKKFIYVSSVLVNGKALGVDEKDAYKNMNSYGSRLEQKRKAEEYIKKSGLDYTIIRPVPMNNDDPRSVGNLYFAKPDTFKLEAGEVGDRVSRDDVSVAIVDAIFNEKASRGTFELVDAKNPIGPTPRNAWWEAK